MAVVDVLEENLDVGSLLNLSSSHLLADLLGGLLDTNNKSVSEGSLTVALVVGSEDNSLLAGHTTVKDDHNAARLETANQRMKKMQRGGDTYTLVTVLAEVAATILTIN